MLPDRTPHIGEYGAKTNAVGDPRERAMAESRRARSPGEVAGAKCGLIGRDF
jgi:hypothetical protein